MKQVHLVYTANDRNIPHFPESSLSLAAVLLAAGFDARITDTAISPQPEWRFDDPLLLGLTVYSNESISTAIDIARQCRLDHPGVPIVWGGPHAQMVPEQTAAHPLADAVCYGEGEGPIVEMARQLAAGRWDPEAISGLMYKGPDGSVRKTRSVPPIDLDALPYSPYHLLRLDRYFISSHKCYYQSSRGCPFSCTFCCDIQQRRWRPRSAPTVLRHLERIVSEFRSREIYFSDANFFVDIRRAEAICRGLVDRDLGIRWSAFCRADTVMRMKDDFLALLARAGCSQLDIGGESGSDQVLARFSKGTTRETLLRAVDRLVRVGIRPELSFITGAPIEAPEDLTSTMSLIDTLRQDFPLATVNGLFHYQPYPNSSLGKETIERWQLPLPTCLEDWPKRPLSAPRREYFPWLDHRQFNRMVVVNAIANYRYFYHRMMDSAEIDVLQRSLPWRFLRLAARVAQATFVRWLVYLRWNMGVNAFPIEWRIYSWLRDRLVRAA